ncbi:YbgA family protein [Vibrio navarrensis]
MEKTGIKVGVSACVLGDKVRFDAGHKLSRFVVQDLGAYMDFVSVCPEVGMGMPVPRPTIRLVSDAERIALVETKNPDKDYSHAMLAYAEQKVSQLMDEELSGYIVCAKSPTCGMEKVKVYKQHGAEKEGVGLYTQTLMRKMPWLPVEEDGRLHDPVLRENFITRVYCLHDFNQNVARVRTRKSIVDFHSRYKLTLMAHHPQSYRELGRLVAAIAEYDLEAFVPLYREGLMRALTHRASRKNNTNVLMHLQGYFKKVLNKEQKAELARTIDEYRQGMLPLLAPLTLIKHYLNTYPDDYLHSQKFLAPHPQELKLRYGL